MPIEFNCQSCGERLRVPEEHVNKKARCPKCQALNFVPGESVATQPTPAIENWHVKLEDGRTYGPVSREELDRWQAEGRITPHSQVLSERVNRWQWAGELWPTLGIPPNSPTYIPSSANTSSVTVANSSVNPFGERDQNPYAAPRTTFMGTHQGRPHRGGLILALGLLGFMFCPLLGPFAVFMGHSDLSEMRVGRMDREGHGLTMAGVITGWIGLAILALQLLVMGLFFLGVALS